MANLSRRDFIKKSSLAAAGGGLLLAGCSAAPAGAAERNTKSLKVRAAVFSPTGGTMNAAYLLAGMFSNEPEMIDQTALGARQREISFGPDELAIWAAPSYAGRIPYVPGLFANLKGDKTPCVLVAAYGHRACENNFAQMSKIASENGFIVIGAIAIVTPHVFGARAGRARPNLEDSGIIRTFAAQVAEKINTGALSPVAVEGSSDLGKKYESAVEKKYVPDNCIKCGLCVQGCPVGAIDAMTLAIDGGPCIHCQRCTYVCRFNARSYAANWDATDSRYVTPYHPVEFIV